MGAKPVSKEHIQCFFDLKLGKFEYEVLHYSKNREPARIQHKCGNIIEKPYSYFQQKIIGGNASFCKCSHSKTGPQSKSVEDRQSELDRLFDNSYTIKRYEHTDKPMTVEHKCGYEFNVMFSNLRINTAKCRCLTTKNGYIGIKRHQEEITERYGEGYTVLEYNWAKKEAEGVNTYRHDMCGHVWQSSRLAAMYYTRMCPKCCGPNGTEFNRNKIEDVELKINDGSKRQYKVIDYKRARDPFYIECKACKNKQRVYLASRVYNLGGFKCTGCGDSASLVTVVVNNKRFIIRGYEPQALNILIAEGFSVKDIRHSRKRIPKFTYKCKNKIHSYYPDFYIKSINTVIEVKSDYTLGITNSKKLHGSQSFIRNKAKAKSVIAKGYNFRLMVIDNKGKEIRLPQDWYTWRRVDLMKYLKT